MTSRVADQRTQLKRDWHQCRLLSRDAVRQLIDSALSSRDSDPTQFAVWMLALIATPPAFFAATQMLLYTSLKNAPDVVVLSFALQHWLFFVTYAMLAAALLASLTWEALFPDGRDQEIIGVLPVRPYVFAASRLGAAAFVGLVFAAAVNLPAAAMYGVFSGGHRIFGWNIHGLFLGHAVATMTASFAAFFTLLILRGAVGIAFGPGAGTWAGALLQLISVVAMFETFFFLPGILNTLSMAMLRGDATLVLFPPAWFASMHAWMAGHGNTLLQAAMLRGLMAFLVVTAVVVPIYLLPAKWLAARALEKRSRERAAATTFLVHHVSAASRATPPVRSVCLFAVASLVRSRRHHLVLASYAGIALAVCLALYFFVEERGSAKIDRPASWMLTMPLLFLFFGLAGLRASFRIPTEAEANWPFRLVPPSLSACVNGTILAMFAIGVLPVALLTAAILLLNWTFVDAVVAVLLQNHRRAASD